MAWTVELTRTAQKQLRKLDKQTATRIAKYLRTRVANTENPRRTGKALTGERGELWRYRVGDYRLICKIEDERVTVLVLEIGHRREVYR